MRKVSVTNAEGPPVPIPNTEVKLCSGENTLRATVREDSSMLGKEKRKDAPSKEGFLGVEGTEADLLRRLLEPFASGVIENETEREEITKADLYSVGLTGGNDSAQRRDDLALSLGLPKGMTPNALLAALNVIMTRKELLDSFK